MHRISAVFSVLVTAIMLVFGIAQADTTTSGGQALIPPFTVQFLGSTHYSSEKLSLANISNDPVHVVIEYYKQSGEVAKNIEMDLAAKASTELLFNGSDTPGALLHCYGVIRWTGTNTLQKPLLAHATLYYLYQTSSFRNYNITGLPINSGLPF